MDEKEISGKRLVIYYEVFGHTNIAAREDGKGTWHLSVSVLKDVYTS